MFSPPQQAACFPIVSFTQSSLFHAVVHRLLVTFTAIGKQKLPAFNGDKYFRTGIGILMCLLVLLFATLRTPVFRRVFFCPVCVVMICAHPIACRLRLLVGSIRLRVWTDSIDVVRASILRCLIRTR